MDLMAPVPPGLDRVPIEVEGLRLEPFLNGEAALCRPMPT